MSVMPDFMSKSVLPTGIPGIVQPAAQTSTGANEGHFFEALSGQLAEQVSVSEDSLAGLVPEVNLITEQNLATDGKALPADAAELLAILLPGALDLNAQGGQSNPLPTQPATPPANSLPLLPPSVAKDGETLIPKKLPTLEVSTPTGPLPTPAAGLALASQEASVLAMLDKRQALAVTGTDILNISNLSASTQSLNTSTNFVQSAQAQLSIPVPLHQAGWDQALGQRVTWLVNQQNQAASLQLNPPELGPLEVRIQVRNAEASVNFSSAHGVVREAIEAAIPQLREMLSASGLHLANVNVSQHSFADSRQRFSQDGQGQNAQPQAETEFTPNNVDVKIALGLVDYYA